VVKELAQGPTVYAPSAAVRAAMGLPAGGPEGAGTARSLRIVTRGHDEASQLAVSRQLERALEGAGAAVSGMQRLLERRRAFEDHLVIVTSALLLATALVVLVGGLGLASTLTLNVVERTREIGILSAIGAGPRAISRLVVIEGLLIGAASWCLAILAAVPVTAAIEVVSGRIFVKTALDVYVSPRAAAEWLALVLILAGLSSFYPAWRAARLTVREALAYA
jgi:putative ABC transport system permease protein